MKTDSGKFAGQPAYVPWLFIERGVTGCDYESRAHGDFCFSVYFVDGELRQKFPKLLSECDYAILIWEENGSIKHENMTKNQYETFMAECESE